MDSSVSPKDEIWFLRVCHHISSGLYCEYRLEGVYSDSAGMDLTGVSFQVHSWFQPWPCSELRMFPSGLFLGAWILYADVTQHTLFHSHRQVPVCLWRWNRVCCVTLAYKIQAPWNYPEESIQVCIIHSVHILTINASTNKFTYTIQTITYLKLLQADACTYTSFRIEIHHGLNTQNCYQTILRSQNCFFFYNFKILTYSTFKKGHCNTQTNIFLLNDITPNLKTNKLLYSDLIC